ncbi:unnamed protein product [Nippostrongylus brasiliensis]|uniref:Origin recognition complex subunit 1 n=1 Tax=Nippostrongylus brasiliensis TaxID=27835 RepID=A0A0N4XZX7_NIPBR|nr:unnamed protein product [Nippostrongylus brasiliensis]
MRSDAVGKVHALLSRWTTLTHIHCYGVGEADVLDEITRELEELQRKDKVSVNYIMVLNNTYSRPFYRKGSPKLTIVLDQAQFLSNFPTTTVKSLLSLPKSMPVICPDLSEGPHIRFVTHSELPWDRIGMLNVLPQPVSIGFMNRSEEECVDMICEAVDAEVISRKVIEFIVKSVFFECRDTARILEIVRIACEKYTEKHGDIKDIKNMKLLPVLEALDETDYSTHDEGERIAPSDIPLSVKYLIVASFCASHNPPTTDKRYFAKFHGKEKRSEARERRAEQTAEQRDAEAKQADLQRIKCIYLALTSLYPPKCIDMVVDINPQIATLCSTGLLTRTTSAANLDQPRFRCLESFENVNEIAQSLGIPLTTYLDGWM